MGPPPHTLVSQQTWEVAWAGECPGLGAHPVLGLLPLPLSLGWLESPVELRQAVPTLRARSRAHPEARPSWHLPLTPLRRGSPRVPWSHHEGILLWRGRFPWQLPSSAPINTFHSQWGSAAGGWGTMAGCHPAPVAPTPHERTSDTSTSLCVPSQHPGLAPACSDVPSLPHACGTPLGLGAWQGGERGTCGSLPNPHLNPLGSVALGSQVTVLPGGSGSRWAQGCGWGQGLGTALLPPWRGLAVGPEEMGS